MPHKKTEETVDYIHSPEAGLNKCATEHSLLSDTADRM